MESLSCISFYSSISLTRLSLPCITSSSNALKPRFTINGVYIYGFGFPGFFFLLLLLLLFFFSLFFHLFFFFFSYSSYFPLFLMGGVVRLKFIGKASISDTAGLVSHSIVSNLLLSRSGVTEDYSHRYGSGAHFPRILWPNKTDSWVGRKKNTSKHTGF